jgi:pimeloyl-ACP methyl ester carboxylesterase
VTTAGRETGRSTHREATMHSFRAHFPQEGLDDLRRRLAETRLPDEVGDGDWSRGVPVGYLRDLIDHWQHGFDWRAVEDRLNARPQLLAEIDGTLVHVIHVRSPEPGAVPLLITHGWPGSVLEFLDVIGPLTDPRAHGGDPARAFHVVLPSIPGFGLSSPLGEPGCDVGRVAGLWIELMARLGYDRYLLQGGDLGSFITLAAAAMDPEHVLGAHLNFLVTPPSGPEDLDGLSEADLARLGRLSEFFESGSAYMRVQATRPQTIAYSLTDSPAGQLAWVVEKYREWSDCAERPEEVIDRDDILANVTLTWLTATAGSAANFYYEIADQMPGAPGAGAPPPPLVPVAVSVYPGDPAPPVRALAERVIPKIVQWREHERGGHFPSLEQPELYVQDLRDFAAGLAPDGGAR